MILFIKKHGITFGLGVGCSSNNIFGKTVDFYFKICNYPQNDYSAHFYFFFSTDHNSAIIDINLYGKKDIWKNIKYILVVHFLVNSFSANI